MPLVKNEKLTISAAESPAGTLAAMAYVVPIKGHLQPFRKPGRMADPAIIGSNMKVGDYLGFDDLKATLPLSPRCVPGFGALLKSHLGSESTPARVAACIRIRYIGTDASAKVVSSSTGNTLACLTGVAGSEADNAVWGGGSAIDLTAAGFDTVGELVAAIEAYAGFECDKVFGTDAAVTKSNLCITKTGQANDKWCYIWFGHGANDAYVRHYTGVYTATERPTYSMQLDNDEDEYSEAGCMVDKLSISGTKKAMIEGSAEILAFAETLSIGASALTLADRPPLFFYDGACDFGVNDYTAYIQSITIDSSNNSSAEGYAQGSVGRQYHEKGMYTLSGSMVLRMDATTYAHRAEIFASPSTPSALSIYFKSTADVIASGGAGDTGIPEMLLIEIPWVQITDFEFSESGDRYTASVKWEAIYAKGTVWDVPITISMVNADSAAY